MSTAVISKFDHGVTECTRKTADEMDEIRHRTLAYQYLCHLEETKVWLEACLKEKLPSTTDLEENFRNGVYLAKLGHFISPETLLKHKIYDIEQNRYKVAGLQFRHTDNINQWLKVLQNTDLPKTFHPETTDVYDKKNMPRVIYCLHALSAHLFKLGQAPRIEDLYGKAQFTDEQINSMSKELKRYGIVMPSFQKIGGLLSSDVGDFAALHAAIINVNKSIESNESFKNSLLNPAAGIRYILPELLSTYQAVLEQARNNKIQNFLNKSADESYVADVYDEHLNQVEIQGYITTVNTSHTLEKIFKYLENNDDVKLYNNLSEPWMNLKSLNRNNRKAYMSLLKKFRKDYGDYTMNHIDCSKVFQTIIYEGNSTANVESSINEAVSCINKALDENSCANLYEGFKNLNKNANVIDIEEFFMPLFYEELQLNKIDYGRDLSYEDILKNIRILSTVAQISKLLDVNNSDIMWEFLNSNILEIKCLRKEALQEYYRGLKTARRAKQQAGLQCTLLTLMDIQECVDVVNEQDDKTRDLIDQLEMLNKAVRNNDKQLLMDVLSLENFDCFRPLKVEESTLYMNLFKTYMKKKHNTELWLEDIKAIMVEAQNEVAEVESICKTLVESNLALLRMNCHDFMRCIYQLDVTISDDLDSKKKVFEIFSNAFEVNRKNNECPWVVFHTLSGKTAYINVETYSHSWSTPRDFIPNSRYLSMKDIYRLLENYKNEHYEMKQKKAIDSLVRFQAQIRGYILRKMIHEMLYYKKHQSQIIRIQAWWRSVTIQKRYGNILRERIAKKKMEKQKPKDVWLHYKENVNDIIRIQALWRGRKTRQAFLSLFHTKEPQFKVVKYFVPLLDFSTEDYEKEILLQTLRADAVQTIRKNQSLSKQLDDMDVKIGLLIQNRITLQDVLVHRTKMNDLAKQSNLTLPADTMKPNERAPKQAHITTSMRGLKSLTKESRKILDGYQHLFYTLQTNPKYLSKLLFCLPQNRTNQFLQNVILTLYNFGSNARDEYLLLKLFRCSLEEEVDCKFNKPMEVITGNPIVLKMAVNHSRQNGLANLRSIIGPLVEMMLNDKTISIETSPVDIYKAWRNQMESHTGQVSTLPYVVTQDQALSYEEVRVKLRKGLETLTKTVKLFLDKIINSYDSLPFSIIYMARVLHHTLIKKFPLAQEKEILKVIGHLVYYQFINAAIVAPDAFQIVNLRHDQPLTNDQRRNLASVAKILHFSASKKGFGEESAHLQCLNPFIIDCHEKMKEFFRKCCQGSTLEEYFSMDEYSEATLLYKPQIYISVQEICDTHSLLVEYEDIIAPEIDDKLHEILDHLGPSDCSDTFPIANLVASTSTEVCLTLIDKDQSVPEDLTDINKLFIKTKELCVSVLPFLNGEHLLEALCIGTTKEQQDQYKAYVEQKLYSGMIKPEENMTLREHITLLRKYLNRLEDKGYVTREDGYQSIVTAIGLDLCNKGKYRRNQVRALQMMKNTKKVLDQKFKYYQDQSDYYNQYINKCLENLNAGKKSVHSLFDRKSSKNRKMKSKASVKYTASKLYDKGILIEIDGLTVSQFKNVLFEFIPTEHNGIFSIKGKFMGVEVDKIELDIQYLLQLQYEGCAIMDLFGKAKVNINLLLFLLNSKFYGKLK